MLTCKHCLKSIEGALAILVLYMYVQSMNHVNSLRHHGLQHARLPCPSQSPRVCSNSCPLTWWCHPTTLSTPSLSALSISAGIRVFFQWVGSSFQVGKVWSFSFSISPSMNVQGWLISLISLPFKGLSRDLSKISV